MSSYTHIAIRPRRPPPTIQTGQRAVSLNSILGRGGRRLLHEALDQARDRRTDGEALPAVLAWETDEPGQRDTEAGRRSTDRADRRSTHRLRLDRDTLPASLRRAGAQGLTVSLQLDGAIASVRYEVRSKGKLANDQQQLAETTAHRAFNHLVAFALANRITSRVQKRLATRVAQRVRERARLEVAEREVYRTYAHTGGPGGGTPWP